MTRWIAFDDESAEAVVTRFRRGAAEIHEGDPLDAALALGRPCVLLLPSSTPGNVLLVRCTPPIGCGSNQPVAQHPAPPAEQVFKRPPHPQRTEDRKEDRERWWQRRGA